MKLSRSTHWAGESEIDRVRRRVTERKSEGRDSWSERVKEGGRERF